MIRWGGGGEDPESVRCLHVEETRVFTHGAGEEGREDAHLETFGVLFALEGGFEVPKEDRNDRSFFFV